MPCTWVLMLLVLFFFLSTSIFFCAADNPDATHNYNCRNNVMTMMTMTTTTMLMIIMTMMTGFKLHHLSRFQNYAHSHPFRFPNDIGRVGENGPWDQVPQINTKSNITSYQVTNLIPFTVYSFRLRAVNKLGISPPSKESYYIVSLREGKKTIKIIIYNSHLFTLAVCVMYYIYLSYGVCVCAHRFMCELRLTFE